LHAKDVEQTLGDYIKIFNQIKEKKIKQANPQQKKRNNFNKNIMMDDCKQERFRTLTKKSMMFSSSANDMQNYNNNNMN